MEEMIAGSGAISQVSLEPFGVAVLSAAKTR